MRMCALKWLLIRFGSYDFSHKHPNKSSLLHHHQVTIADRIDWLSHKIVQTVTVRRTASIIDREALRRTKLAKTRHQKYQKLFLVLLTEIGDGQDCDKAVKRKACTLK